MATRKNSTNKKTNKRNQSGAAQRPTRRKKIVSLAQYEADAQAPVAEPTVDTAPEATTIADVGPEPKKSPKPAKGRGPSGLDSAVRVLAEAGKPLTTGEMVRTMLEKGYWKTSGKTPAATLYSAILRETGGPGSRFEKTERGKFALTPAGQADLTDVMAAFEQA